MPSHPGKKRAPKKASQVRAIFANAKPKAKKKLASEIRTGRVRVKGGRKAIGKKKR